MSKPNPPSPYACAPCEHCPYATNEPVASKPRRQPDPVVVGWIIAALNFADWLHRLISNSGMQA